MESPPLILPYLHPLAIPRTQGRMCNQGRVAYNRLGEGMPGPFLTHLSSVNKPSCGGFWQASLAEFLKMAAVWLGE